eukprot:g3446.t1
MDDVNQKCENYELLQQEIDRLKKKLEKYLTISEKRKKIKELQEERRRKKENGKGGKDEYLDTGKNVAEGKPISILQTLYNEEHKIEEESKDYVTQIIDDGVNERVECKRAKEFLQLQIQDDGCRDEAIKRKKKNLEKLKFLVPYDDDKFSEDEAIFACELEHNFSTSSMFNLWWTCVESKTMKNYYLVCSIVNNIKLQSCAPQHANLLLAEITKFVNEYIFERKNSLEEEKNSPEELVAYFKKAEQRSDSIMIKVGNDCYKENISTVDYLEHCHFASNIL